MRGVVPALVSALLLTVLVLGLIYGHINRTVSAPCSDSLRLELQARDERFRNQMIREFDILRRQVAAALPFSNHSEPPAGVRAGALSMPAHQTSCLSRAHAGMCSFIAAHRRASGNQESYERCFDAPADTIRAALAENLGPSHVAFRKRVAAMKTRSAAVHSHDTPTPSRHYAHACADFEWPMHTRLRLTEICCASGSKVR